MAEGNDAHWIEDMNMKEGALHKELKVPAGEHIPEKALEKGEHAKSPLERKRTNLAEELGHLRPK